MSVTKTNSFVKNFSILSAGEIISHAISMLTNILLARLLSPESFGEYTLLLTYIFIFYTVSSLGLRQVIIRLIARNQSNSKYLFYYSVFLRIIGFVFSMLVFFVYDLFYNPGLSNFLILALFAGVFVQTAWETLQNVAFGMQRMEWTSIINVVGNFFLLGLYLVLPKNYCSVIVVVVLYVFVFLLKDFAYLISLYKFHLLTGKWKLKNNYWGPSRKLLAESFPFYVLAIFSLFSNQIPIIFLQNNSNLTEVAYYNTANKLMLPITMLVSTTISAVYPVFAKNYVSDMELFAKQVKNVLSLFTIIGIFGCLIITFFRNEMVYIIYGEMYKNTGDVMAYQCWYTVMLTVFSLIGNVFGAADRQKLLALTSIAYACVNVPILYYFSFYGAVGLAIGTIVASVINMTYNYYYLWKTVEGKISVGFTIKIFAILVLSFFISMLLPDFNFYIKTSFALLSVLILIKYRKYLLSLVDVKILNK